MAPARHRPLQRTRPARLILLAPEGINLFIAGTREAADAFIAYIRHDPLFEGKFASLQFRRACPTRSRSAACSCA